MQHVSGAILPDLQLPLIGKDHDMAVFSLRVGVRAVEGAGTQGNVNERFCKRILAAKRWRGASGSGGERCGESNRNEESHSVK